jgi:TetR/AcrR family transcriptional regulator, fatty acid metabolism regulator protein
VAAPLTQTREHLVRTAYELIGERGVHRVSLEEIAASAGVSKGLILYYFKSRENLVLATMEWVLTRVAERIRAAVELAGSPAAQVVAMVDVIFAGAETNRRFYLTYLEFTEHVARLARFGRLAVGFGEIVDSVYEDVVRFGAERGEFQVRDVGETASALRALVDGLFLQWLQEADWRRTHAQYRERCKRALLEHLHARQLM